MNYWVYFNSKPVPKPADLVIFDDAHLAEQPLSSLQTLRIPDKLGPARVLYRTICDLVVAHTDAYPGLQAMRDGTARPGTPPELLSFSDWAAIATAARRGRGVAIPERQRDQVRVAEGARSPQSLRCADRTIRNRNPPVRLRPRSTRATARRSSDSTYHDARLDGDLQRRVGGGRITRLVTEEPLPAGATGERLLVLNPSGGQPTDENVLTGHSIRSRPPGRAAWLCASHAEADALQAQLASAGHAVYPLQKKGKARTFLGVGS